MVADGSYRLGSWIRVCRNLNLTRRQQFVHVFYKPVYFLMACARSSSKPKLHGPVTIGTVHVELRRDLAQSLSISTR